MKQYHPQTGEVLQCQHCKKDAHAFIAGLYPVCKEHGEEFQFLQGTTWERMRKMNEAT